jgi:uncharacterized protein (TIGR00251 family)
VSDSPARWQGADLLLSLHVQPGAARPGPAGLHAGALKLRVRARAVEGAANEAVISFIAESFAVPRRSVEILSGDRGREKRLRIAAPDPALAAALLARWGC